MFLESLVHEHSSFVTLTYDDENLPEDGSLNPKEAQLWLKKLRKLVHPAKVRYFLVGEYGPQTLRPHYHACLFGVSALQAALVQQAWGKGFTSTYMFNEKTAQYVAGYVVKKLQDRSDPRLEDLYPEFARMSLKPGIGSTSMSQIAASLKSSKQGIEAISKSLDVPKFLQLGRRKVPLGRYLIRQLRKEFGFTEDDITAAKMEISHRQSEELSALHQAAQAVDPSKTLKEAFEDSIAQRILNVEARAKLTRKGTL